MSGARRAAQGDRAPGVTGLRLVQQLPHYRVEHDAAHRLVRISRTAEPLTLDDIARVFAVVRASLASVPYLGSPGRPANGPLLLMDARGGPANNDPIFERAMREPVTSLYSLFRRRAVVVRSAVGALQVTRLARDRRLDGEEVQRVFLDEAEALAWLLR